MKKQGMPKYNALHSANVIKSISQEPLVTDKNIVNKENRENKMMTPVIVLKLKQNTNKKTFTI